MNKQKPIAFDLVILAIFMATTLPNTRAAAPALTKSNVHDVMSWVSFLQYVITLSARASHEGAIFYGTRIFDSALKFSVLKIMTYFYCAILAINL
ncbi:hypothetical protein [Pseudobacteriovorax antillogorgiicola]|uniref:Uncharacterized protein n=1 Tax=Pseudobacteriovorax antillogorgiicola TaxID=1513793 RepID=A0A1Y6BC43_9BACT|nr:hypothetical protein [Pseudobacteriovorax antillogorgiicola]TCS57369.1 hypothetical protein EDD56_103109 [Pseudobacteriovorax antillogorgiicola]SMF01929.1 hypothetical protein SAMN06296036_103224 [Pseudobacteriovorax antillogorgiicola]